MLSPSPLTGIIIQPFTFPFFPSLALRRLTEQRKHVEKKHEKRDIVTDYTSFDSQVYAPMTRIGVYLDAGSEEYVVKNQYNTTLNGMLYAIL